MEIKYHLPGLCRNLPINLTMLCMQETRPEVFRDGVRIVGIYGDFPNSVFNGGRITMVKQQSKEFIASCVDTINQFDVAVEFTYTNVCLVKLDLSDEHCNYCLQVAHSDMNKVIVASDIMEDYIRTTYPKYGMVSSMSKCLDDEQVLPELDKDYSMIVLPHRLNHNYDFIRKCGNVGKIELIVNPTCTPDCPVEREHYKVISQIHKELSSTKQRSTDYWNKCPSSYNLTDNLSPACIAPSEIESILIPIGVENYKIQGRFLHPNTLVDQYVKYLIKEEFQSEIKSELYEFINNHYEFIDNIN